MNIHELKGPNQQWATIEEGASFWIVDGWNCGVITQKIQFPDLTSVRFYLAGKWMCPSSAISLVATRERLSKDERILKAVHQWMMGKVTENEMLGQLLRLNIDDVLGTIPDNVLRPIPRIEDHVQEYTEDFGWTPIVVKDDE